MSPRTRAIAHHAEAAKRLLRELEQQAETALHALGGESGSDFVAAVTERDRILAQLNEVVEALSQERLGGDSEPDAEMSSLFAEMAHAAASALESHNELTSQTRRERDRLAALLHRSNQQDAVANQYAATAGGGARPRSLSVTG